MIKSDKLAKCDMVLALSENTINYQFQKLWQRSIIAKDWKLLVRNADTQTGEAAVVKTQKDQDFNSDLASWQAAQKDIFNLYSEGKYEEYGQALKGYKTKKVLYDYGWTSSINAPQISIISSDHQRLFFTIKFNSGQLFYCKDFISDLLTYTLSDVEYVFTVPIGRVEIATHEILMPEAQKQANQVIRDSGLTDADFNIESLFLNFENANISNFDAAASHFPHEMSLPLQVAISDYFKLVVAGSTNPYVLGYGMSIKELKHEQALFQPTALRFSTSYSDKIGYSCFNFLTMLGGAEFLTDQDVGILTKSLLEIQQTQGRDMSGIDGVFAINYSIFKDSFLTPFIETIQKSITQGFGDTAFSSTGQKWSLASQYSATKNTDEPPSDFGKSTHIASDMKLTSEVNISNQDSSHLLLKAFIKYNLDVKVRPWSILHWDYHTEGEYWLSTSGQYKEGPKNHKGQEGGVKISIAPGAQGHMTVNIDSVQPPYLGHDREPYNGFKGGIGIWGVIESDWQSFAEDDAEKASLEAAQKLESVIDDVKKALQHQINSFNNAKVILPLGEIYTFESIQLYTSDNVDDNPVLFNVKYAPETMEG